MRVDVALVLNNEPPPSFDVADKERGGVKEEK